MTIIIYPKSKVTGLRRSSKGGDIKTPPGYYINASRRKTQCDCCGRQLRELKPYGKAGDPLESDFEGKFLVKALRPTIPSDAEADKKWEEFFGNSHSKKDYRMVRERLVQAYGEEEVLKIEAYKTFSSPLRKVWLCRDCIILEADDYLEVRGKDESSIINSVISVILGHTLSTPIMCKKPD
jgi:hypothetical protein